MMSTNEESSVSFTVQRGWNHKQSVKAAELYEQAFGEKFRAAIPSTTDRLALLSECLIPEFSLCSLDEGEMIGLAGFQTELGALTGGITLSTLLKHCGLVKGMWAALVLSLLDREANASELVMDGIVVDAAYRGQGIGAELLDGIIEYARDQGYERVRLDVIDTNPRAKALYQRKGFEAKEHTSFPWLKWLIGFSGATTMVYELVPLKQ